MKKSLKIILCALAALALAAAALAAVRIIRHEKDQNEALRDLAEQVITLQEERQAAEAESASEENISELKDRLTRLEVRAGYADADYRYFAIGNSITVHAPNEVWWDNAGMAASSADRDFVHLVDAFLSETYGKTACYPFYFYTWEISPGQRAETLSLLDPYLDPDLQLVTIQLGENAEDLSDFGQDFEALIRYVREKAPSARILVIDDFWTREDRGQMKREAAAKTGAEFISLEEIRDNPAYQAGVGATVLDAAGEAHTIENADVAAHPGDNAMQYIADRIIEAIGRKP